MHAEQLALEEGPAPIPSAWDWARKACPGKPIIRVIDLKLERQAFIELKAEEGLNVDGSTHFLHTPLGGLTITQEQEIIAYYDRCHAQEHPCP